MVYNNMILYSIEVDNDLLQEKPIEYQIEVCSDETEIPDRIDTSDKTKNDFISVAWCEGEVAGYLWFSVRDNYEITGLNNRYYTDGGYIYRVVVDPEFRRQGVAASMLKSTIKWARTNSNVQDIFAFVAANNLPSKRLFEGLGFNQSGRIVSAKVGPFEYEQKYGLAR